MKKLLIIDSHSILYKSHFAFSSRPLSNKSGLTTSALFGFTRAFLSTLQKFSPSHICFAFDKSRETFRRQIYTEYKAHRSATPTELKEQFPYAEKIAHSLNIPTVKLDNFEADDILGSLSANLSDKHPDLEIFLISGDRDTFQLAKDRVYIAYTSSKSPDGYIIYDADKIRTDYGLEPIDLIQVKALQGDASDNIPGIRGIGEKTALKLIREHRNLENIYQNIELFKGALKEKLCSGRADAELSRSLAAIRQDIPIPLTLEELAWQGVFTDEFIAVMQELEFNSLLRQLNLINPIATQESQKNLMPPAKPTGETPTKPTDEPPAKAPTTAATTATAATATSSREIETHTVLSTADWQKLWTELEQSPVIAFDVETSSLNRFTKCLIGISLSTRAFSGYYVPLHHRYLSAPKQLPESLVISDLQKLFRRTDKVFVAHNIKFDMAVLENYGLEFPAHFQDTMLLAHLLYPLEKHGLKYLTAKFLNYHRESFKEILASQKNFAEISIEVAAKYSAADAENSLQLYEMWLPELQQRPELFQLYTNVELELIKVLAKMEKYGVCIDPVHFQNLATELRVHILQLHHDIMLLSKEDFNLNSPKQLSQMLFDKLKITTAGVKKTSQGYSTANDVLEKLRTAHPICALIADYRHLNKLQGTYVLPLPQNTDQNNRLHTSFSQTTVATGRLSSLEPNLQNIPVRSEWGRKIRQGFIPSKPENLLLSIDYSQIELRVLAHICADKNLQAAFHAGRDIHTETAAKVFNVSTDLVSKNMRESAKAINFGIIYGMGAFSLSNQLKIGMEQAKEFISTYFQIYPDIYQFMENTEKQAQIDGGIYTMFGRFRPIEEIKASHAGKRAGGRRIAINSRIQGSAAEIIKKAMIAVEQLLRQEKAATQIILQVHDELLFDMPKHELHLIPKCKALMEQIIECAVPLVCDVEIGRNWGELQPYDDKTCI